MWDNIEDEISFGLGFSVFSMLSCILCTYVYVYMMSVSVGLATDGSP